MLTAIILGAAVFVASAALDYVEAFYVRSVGALDGHRAGAMSVAMYLIGIVGFVAILDYSYWLMVPECAGLYFGSRLAVHRLRRVEDRSLHT